MKPFMQLCTPDADGSVRRFVLAVVVALALLLGAAIRPPRARRVRIAKSARWADPVKTQIADLAALCVNRQGNVLACDRGSQGNRNDRAG